MLGSGQSNRQKFPSHGDKLQSKSVLPVVSGRHPHVGLSPDGSKDSARYLSALPYHTLSQFWALSTQLPFSLLERRGWAGVGRWGDEVEPAVWVQSQGQECLGFLCQSLSCFQPSDSWKKWIPMASFPHQFFMPPPPSTSGGKA